MKCKIGPSFSGTEGAGNSIQKCFVFNFDIEKCSYLGDNALTSLADFQNAKLGKGVSTRQFPKLQALKKGLEEYYSNTVDPIQYILFLYYSEELSSYEVLERCQEFGLPYKNQSAFVKFMTGSLKWELRDNKEMTERRRRKISRKSNPSVQGLRRISQKIVEGNRQTFQEATENILNTSQNVNRVFSLEELSRIKNNSDKVFYILECFESLSFQNICLIVKYSGLGAKVIADIINEKLKEIHKKNDKVPVLSISQGSIHRLLKIHGLRE